MKSREPGQRKPGTFLPGNRASVGNKGGGRPPSKVKELAKKKSLDAIKRIIAIYEGRNLVQTLDGKKVTLPATLPEQRKAAETILKVADELGPDIALPASAVNLLDSIEEARKNRGLPL